MSLQGHREVSIITTLVLWSGRAHTEDSPTVRLSLFPAFTLSSCLFSLKQHQSTLFPLHSRFSFLLASVGSFRVMHVSTLMLSPQNAREGRDWLCNVIRGQGTAPAVWMLRDAGRTGNEESHLMSLTSCIGRHYVGKIPLMFIPGFHFHLTLSIMPLSPRDVQRILAILSEEDQLKVTVKNSAYGGLIAGVTTMVGGLFGGPPGLLVGGAVGGALAYKAAGDFRPVSEVVRNMNAHDSQLLYESVREIIENLDAGDYLTVLTFLASGPGLVVRQQLIDKMVDFLSRQMQMYIAP